MNRVDVGGGKDGSTGASWGPVEVKAGSIQCQTGEASLEQEVACQVRSSKLVVELAPKRHHS
jgi:hypothetical protein